MEIEVMTAKHAKTVLEMMRVFYDSPAVLTNGSEEIFKNDIENCINDDPYIEGYVFTSDGITAGYAMLAKSYSAEYGKPCIWIEDLYISPEYRNKGIGPAFIDFVSDKYKGYILRLEVEKENEHAVHVYGKAGFCEIAYTEMVKLT